MIIAQTENLQGPNVIPRRNPDLVAPDVSELGKLHLAQGDSYDDASIMAAKYVLEDRFSEVKVERSKPKKPLKRNHVLNVITTLLKHSQKDGSKDYLPHYVLLGWLSRYAWSSPWHSFCGYS